MLNNKSLRAGRLQAAKIVEPDMTRYIALAFPRSAPLTLACRTVKQIIKEIVKDLKVAGAGSDALPLSKK